MTQELDDVTNEMCKLGVVACDGMPLLTHACTMSFAAFHAAQLAHLNVTLAPSPMNHERSRLQGKASKAIDLVTLSRYWKHAPSNARETIQSVAGPSAGLLWSDCSRDERSGRLQGPSLSASPSQPTRPAVSRVGKHLRTEHKLGHTSGSCAECRSTASARHACRTAGARTRVHHAIRHCVANMCRKAGPNPQGRSLDS